MSLRAGFENVYVSLWVVGNLLLCLELESQIGRSSLGLSA